MYTVVVLYIVLNTVHCAMYTVLYTVWPKSCNCHYFHSCGGGGFGGGVMWLLWWWWWFLRWWRSWCWWLWWWGMWWCHSGGGGDGDSHCKGGSHKSCRRKNEHSCMNLAHFDKILQNCTCFYGRFFCAKIVILKIWLRKRILF